MNVYKKWSLHMCRSIVDIHLIRREHLVRRTPVRGLGLEVSTSPLVRLSRRIDVPTSPPGMC